MLYQVYTFSQGKLKVVTNKQFTTIKNNYELTFDNNSEIKPCQDTADIKSYSFNFVPIANLANCEINHLVDLLGKSVCYVSWVFSCNSIWIHICFLLIFLHSHSYFCFLSLFSCSLSSHHITSRPYFLFSSLLPFLITSYSLSFLHSSLLPFFLLPSFSTFCISLLPSSHHVLSLYQAL